MSFRSKAIRKRINKKKAVTSFTGGQMPWNVAVRRAPLFPVSKKIFGMLYDEASIDQTHATTAQNYFFSANGIYDPNITGTGHQPMGFDTMMLYYEQATVVRSTITVQAYNNSSTVPARIMLSLAPDTTSITDSQELVENGLGVHLDLNTVGSGKMGVVSLGCDVAKYFGRNRGRSILDDVNLYCTAAANPVEQVYFNISSSGILATSGTFNLTFQAILTYDVVFWEPRKVATMLHRGDKFVQVKHEAKINSTCSTV
jgi:hypothetical protein